VIPVRGQGISPSLPDRVTKFLDRKKYSNLVQNLHLRVGEASYHPWLAKVGVSCDSANFDLCWDIQFQQIIPSIEGEQIGSLTVPEQQSSAECPADYCKT
jgi:hypothetical protein